MAAACAFFRPTIFCLFCERPCPRPFFDWLKIFEVEVHFGWPHTGICQFLFLASAAMKKFEYFNFVPWTHVLSGAAYSDRYVKTEMFDFFHYRWGQEQKFIQVCVRPPKMNFHFENFQAVKKGAGTGSLTKKGKKWSVEKKAQAAAIKLQKTLHPINIHLLMPNHTCNTDI